MSRPLQKKLVIVGDGYCGKTSLLMSFKDGQFPEVYVPTVFDDYSANLVVDGHSLQLHLWDTAGQEDYERLRPLAYPDSNVILICFTVDSHSSLDNVRDVWLPEVLHYCHNVPIFLVCCKKDLRNDLTTRKKLARNKQEPLTPEQGMLVAESIGAFRYVECSAKTGENVVELFEAAARSTISKSDTSAGSGGGCCVIL